MFRKKFIFLILIVFLNTYICLATDKNNIKNYSKHIVMVVIDNDSSVVQGVLSKDQIVKIIQDYIGQIEYCYERQIQINSNFPSGKVTFQFIIDKSGKVTDSVVKDTQFADVEIGKSMAAVFRRMTFPSSDGETTATYVLKFDNQIPKQLPLNNINFKGAQLSKDDIAKVIKNSMKNVEKCYEEELKLKPEIKGKLLVNFIIDIDGNIKTSKIASTTMHNLSVETCINSVFKNMKFPKPVGAGIIEVTYPLIFGTEKTK